MKKTLGVGVVGCGMISDIYLTNMIHKFTNLEVRACCAGHIESAERKAAKYGIRATTFEEMLKTDDIDMVVVLTPAPTHYDLIRAALSAGKHVYSEKVISPEYAQAKELLELASEKGLYLGCAPDTFLGASLQAVRQAMDDGLIGTPTGFVVSANRDLDYFVSHYRFLSQAGGGICYDYGVYYLTALVALLGPMARVSAVAGNRKEVRVNPVPGEADYGKGYPYPNESYVNAVLETKSGVSGCFSVNGDSVLNDRSYFLIYGTKGMLRLGDPNHFGGEVYYLPNNTCEGNTQMQRLACDLPFAGNSRGVGPAEMADAILYGRKNRAAGEMAAHVLDVIEQIMASSEAGRMLPVNSCCTRPEPLHREDSAAWTAQE